MAKFEAASAAKASEALAKKEAAVRARAEDRVHREKVQAASKLLAEAQRADKAAKAAIAKALRDEARLVSEAKKTAAAEAKAKSVSEAAAAEAEKAAAALAQAQDFRELTKEKVRLFAPPSMRVQHTLLLV